MLIIQEYLDGASKNSLRRKYNIANSKTIPNWLRIFGIEDIHLSSIPIPMRKPIDESVELTQLRKELKQAKLDLKCESMRADLYETMVDVAEGMFNIPIKKKLAPISKAGLCNIQEIYYFGIV